jgi:transposase-like protein
MYSACFSLSAGDRLALKLLYLALQNVSAKWDLVQQWKQALNQFEILWGDRIKAAFGKAA